MAIEKYSGQGGFAEDIFLNLGLSRDHAAVLAQAGNFGLSASSWKTYKTAEHHLNACMADVGRRMRFPFSVGDVLTFIAWLVDKRKVRAKTILIYLSGLRMAHFQRGHFSINLHSDIVKHVLTGLKQQDVVKDKTKDTVERLPVTMEVMQMLKEELLMCKWDLKKKRLVWAIATMAFNGSFRVHELLSREAQCYDPTSTLLTKDVTCKLLPGQGGASVLQVFLKSPKERRLKLGIQVDLFSTGSYICPVEAYLKYKQSLGGEVELKSPVFVTCTRSGYTGANFNSDIKQLLQGRLDYSRVKITSHSFRAGLATEMGKLGYKDDEIQSIGRWSSQAYLTYVKCARLKRMTIARELSASILAGRRVSC